MRGGDGGRGGRHGPQCKQFHLQAFRLFISSHSQLWGKLLLVAGTSSAVPGALSSWHCMGALIQPSAATSGAGTQAGMKTYSKGQIEGTLLGYRSQRRRRSNAYLSPWCFSALFLSENCLNQSKSKASSPHFENNTIELVKPIIVCQADNQNIRYGLTSLSTNCILELN